MGAMNDGSYALRWKGRHLGELSIAQIRQQLADGNVSRMHQISTEDGWMSVDDFLRRVDQAEAAERQQRQEQRRIEFRPAAPPAQPTPPSAPVQVNAPMFPVPVPAAPALPRSQPFGREARGVFSPHLPTDLGAGGIPFSSFFTRLFRGDRRMLTTSLWMVAAAVLPFVTAPLVQSFKLDTEWIIWILLGYFSLLILGGIYKLSGVPVSVLKKGLGFFAFTIVIGIPLLMQAQQHWPLVKEIYSGTVKDDLSRGILGFVLGVGFFEELCKALPLLFFCMGRGPLRVRDAAFLGMMSGLGFAFAEGVLYTSNTAMDSVLTNYDGVLAVMKKSANQAQFFKNLDVMVKFQLFGVLAHLIRMISLPLMHGAWAGCVGWFVARANALGSWWGIVVGILIVACLHGMYDVIEVGFMGPGLSSIVLEVLIMVVSLLLFASHLLGREPGYEDDALSPSSA